MFSSHMKAHFYKSSNLYSTVVKGTPYFMSSSCLATFGLSFLIYKVKTQHPTHNKAEIMKKKCMQNA